MPTISLSKNDHLMMSLVHYFVTKENYTPIHVHGAKDEIWLENLEGPYRVIRITSSSIINEEQFKVDLFKIKHIIKQIKKKTLSLKINVLNICLDISNKVDMKDMFNINSIKLDNIMEIKNNQELITVFPNIKNDLLEGNNLDLIINVTNDINRQTERNNALFAKVFAPKKIIATKVIIAICIIVFMAMYIFGSGSTNSLTLIEFGANYGPLVQNGEIWRIITSAFLHIGLIHLIVNMYSLMIIGSQLETFVGKFKFLIIYIVSAISGSLFSIVAASTPVVSAGASGAIFGLLGALLYFGYHYRLYLNDALKNQIIPVIILNLALGFMLDGIDVACHIGGLIGGYLVTMALGIEGKSHKRDIINGWIVLILYIIFLSYVTFFLK